MTPVLGPQIGVPVTPTASVRVPAEPGELRYQRCGACDAANFTPTETCRGCSSRALHWAASAGRGSVYSWTVVRRPAAREFGGAYAVAIVDLDEGYRMLTNLVEVEPADIHSGMRVRVDLRPTGGEPVLPLFTPDRD
ncbi:Zn-ribbon domain-containing OB-fold protein [Embleya sp. NBC_00896]|uniref:Zn-ribbon domain-containing OB-fold protein n=1 Tax=Embleya sp. NBC_00896 TaxID=2975961 RepID=UPI0038696527|nr:OB-fold domain-containing protein [Embleya sp. NBC_00896]